MVVKTRNQVRPCAKFLSSHFSLLACFWGKSQRFSKSYSNSWTSISYSTSRGVTACTDTQLSSKIITYGPGESQELIRITAITKLFDQKFFSIEWLSYLYRLDSPSVLYLPGRLPTPTIKSLTTLIFTGGRERFYT